MAKRDKDACTALEKVFCRHFIKTNDGTKAAELTNPKYSHKVAGVRAAQWMARPRVQKEIARLREKLENRGLKGVEETERLLDSMLWRIPKEFVGETGIPKGMHELTDDQAMAVSAIETWEKQNADGTGLLGGTTLRLVSKEGLLKLKMKRLGMLKDTTVHEVGKSFEDVMREIHGLPPAGKEEKG